MHVVHNLRFCPLLAETPVILTAITPALLREQCKALRCGIAWSGHQ
jgi:hypothetical protein